VAPRQDPWRNTKKKRGKQLYWVRTDEHLIACFPRRSLFILRFLDCSTCSLVDVYRRLYPTRRFPPTKHVRPESEVKRTINTCDVIFPWLYACRQSCVRRAKKIGWVRKEFNTIYTTYQGEEMFRTCDKNDSMSNSMENTTRLQSSRRLTKRQCEKYLFT